MDKVEKVARAIYEGTTPVLSESLGPRWTPVDFAIADANTRRVHHVMARAALAAMGEREANDTSYRLEALEMWAWGGRHNMPEHTRQRLPASPRPEAVGEDWRAVDDAIWFYLGHENHKPEDGARLRRMSGVVLGLAGEVERP